MLKKLNLYYIIILISVAFIVLLTIQLYQANELYNQTKAEFDTHISNILNKVSIRHEKVDDYKRYSNFFTQDFGKQYRLALKQEFQNIHPVQEQVSIRDTFITSNGKKKKYLYITGRSYDSLTDVTAKHSILARDISEMGHLVQLGQLDDIEDSTALGDQIGKRVISNLFRKSKYINEMMVNAFRSSDFLDPHQRVDLAFLDSMIYHTFEVEELNQNYSYAITDKNNDIVGFPAETDRYNKKLKLNKSYTVKLFPGNIFDDPIFLHVYFHDKQAALIQEMWPTLLVSFLLIVLIVVSFYVMFQTILKQRKLATLKNDFISNMTHEFKTPISTISLACEAMSDKDMIDEKQLAILNPYVKMITDENKRLSSLVERILQSAILDRGELRLRKEKLEINEIVAKVVHKSKIRVPQGKGSINFTPVTGLHYVEGDPVHTSNIITNLIDNAIKYSKEQIEIKVSTELTSEGIKVVVEDTGIGIKKEHIDKIFDKLYRVPTGNVHDVKGFGLGLSYVKAIVDLQEWDITVKSKFGKGTTFELHILKENKDGK